MHNIMSEGITSACVFFSWFLFLKLNRDQDQIFRFLEVVEDIMKMREPLPKLEAIYLIQPIKEVWRFFLSSFYHDYFYLLFFFVANLSQ